MQLFVRESVYLINMSADIEMHCQAMYHMLGLLVNISTRKGVNIMKCHGVRCKEVGADIFMINGKTALVL